VFFCGENERGVSKGGGWHSKKGWRVVEDDLREIKRRNEVKEGVSRAIVLRG
jgi:hypothetical protein